MAINSNLHRFSLEVLARPFPEAAAKSLPAGVTNMFVHDWATNLNMETTYRTSIAASNDNDSEERRGLLDRPFRTISVVWAGLEKERLGLLLADLRKITDSQWVIPLYQDQVYLDQAYTDGPANYTIYCCPRRRRVHPGGRVVIVTFDANYYPTNVAYKIVSQKLNDRIVLTSNVGFNLAVGRTLILPCLDVEYVLDPSITYASDQRATVSLEFQEIIGPSALPPSWSGLPDGFNTYDGLPIFDPDYDWSTSRTVRYARPGSQVAQGRGIVTHLRGDHARLITGWNIATERERAWEIINFFDSRMGRLIPFWCIDPETIWTASGLATGYVDIEPLGDSTDFQADFDYVGLRMKDGTKVVRPVSGFVITGGYWRVQVSPSFPSGLSVSNVLGVARARKSRFDKDVLSEDWATDDWASFQLDTIELLDDGEVTP
jgi:hypothetical protein